MRVLAFIPARLESRRYPNKVIKPLFNIPMIEHVRRRVILAKVFNDVLIVTNSKILKNKLSNYKSKVILTRNKHSNGTSRIAEISKKFKFDYACIIFADEPFISPIKLSKCILQLKKNNVEVINVITNLKENDLNSNEIVKTVTDKNNNILNYFRKSKKKYPKNVINKSSGILVFKKNIIDNYKKLKVGKNEKKYQIEQLRLLENNIKIKSFFIKNIYPSVNTKQEQEKLLSLVSKDKNEMKTLKMVKNFEYKKL